MRVALNEKSHVGSPYGAIASDMTQRRSQPKRPALMPTPFTWIAGAIMFIASFLIVVRMTRPTLTPNHKIEQLAASQVSDFGSLMKAVKAAGLKGGRDVRGSLDEIKRVSELQVQVKGWAADIAGDGSPLTILAFAGGRNRLMVETSGQHPDIGALVGLSGRLAENVAFYGLLSCNRGEKILIVAVTSGNSYNQFGSRVCP
jgi:hypothetical protein